MNLFQRYLADEFAKIIPRGGAEAGAKNDRVGDRQPGACQFYSGGMYHGIDGDSRALPTPTDSPTGEILPSAHR
jgi:hypothetical protein